MLAARIVYYTPFHTIAQGMPHFFRAFFCFTPCFFKKKVLRLGVRDEPKKEV